MPVITLTSDWNQNDFYLAAVKGQLLQFDKNLVIVDINHNIRPFHISQAAFVIRNAYKYFPEGSVHLIYVDVETSESIHYLAVKADNHYFIAADNGIFSLILNETKGEIVRLENIEHPREKSFPGLKTFTHAAVKIINKGDFTSLGKKTDSFRESFPFRATIEEDSIIGSIIYVDSYGNVITNITRELFERVGKKHGFEIFVQSKHYTLNEINSSYNSVQQGELVAVFNSSNLLEIAINKGNASRLFNLNLNSTIRIEFLNR